MSINPFESSINKYSSISNSANVSKVDDVKLFNEFNFDVNNQQIGTDRFLYSVDNLSASNKKLLIESLEVSLNDIDEEFKTAKKSNGWLSGAWDKFKDVTHIGAGSNKTKKEIEVLKKSIKELNSNPDKFVETYKKVTGKELTDEDLTKLLNGEISFKDILKANESLNKYTEGQKMVTDVVGDIVSGIVSVGAVAVGSALGICAAPFTAGASLGLVAAGLGVGAAAGAAVKVAIKGSDCIGNEKKYELKDIGYDLITGSINGAMGPVSNAIGGATGTAVMKAMGMKSLETTAKNAVVKMTAQRVIATGADMVVDGTISGATDGFARALGEGRIEDIPKEMMTGAVGGAIAAPIIGGGFKIAGKAGSAAGHAIQKAVGKEVSENVGDVVAREIGGTVAGEVAEQTGKQTAEVVGGEVAEQVGKETAENIAGEAAEKAGKEVAENIGGEVAEQTGKEAVETVNDGIVNNVIKEADDPIVINQDINNNVDINLSPTEALDPTSLPPSPIDTDVHSNVQDVTPDTSKTKVNTGEQNSPRILVDDVDVAQKAKIDAKISELQAKSSKISFADFKLEDGSTSKFMIFEGTQGGSNSGYYVKNTNTGELFYVKYASKTGKGGVTQSQAEVLSSKLYKLAGIDVPELSLVDGPNGQKAILSKFIPDLQGVNKANPLVHEGFGMDALLANWDVVGLGYDNTVTNGSKVFRIDVGGTLDFRAQGAKKPFGSVVDELSSLIDPNINPQSAKVFASMTPSEMISSIKKVTSISDDEIIKLLKSEGMEKYTDAILKRKAYLQEFVDIADQMPNAKNMSLLQFAKTVKNETTKATIEKANTQVELALIQESIDSVQEPQLKQSLQKLLDDKSLSIKQNAVKLYKPISEKDFLALMKKSGLKKGIQGNYYINVTSDFEKKILDTYGASLGNDILSIIKKPILPSELSEMRKFMNVANGKYVSYWQDNTIDLLAYFKVLSKNASDSKSLFANFDKISDPQWAAIMNTVYEKAPQDVINSLKSYKGMGYGMINGELTQQRQAALNGKLYTIEPSIKNKIEKISAYIDTQPIEEAMHVYRGEGTEVLASCKLNNGKTLKEAIEAIQYAPADKKQQLINEVIEDVLDNNYEAHQERFMSTSLVGVPDSFKDIIRWDLELPAGTKGVFIEGANINAGLANEVEYLIQKGSDITIIGIEYIPAKGSDSAYWQLKGKLKNNIAA